MYSLMARTQYACKTMEDRLSFCSTLIYDGRKQNSANYLPLLLTWKPIADLQSATVSSIRNARSYVVQRKHLPCFTFFEQQVHILACTRIAQADSNWRAKDAAIDGIGQPRWDSGCALLCKQRVWLSPVHQLLTLWFFKLWPSFTSLRCHLFGNTPKLLVS